MNRRREVRSVRRERKLKGERSGGPGKGISSIDENLNLGGRAREKEKEKEEEHRRKEEDSSQFNRCSQQVPPFFLLPPFN